MVLARHQRLAAAKRSSWMYGRLAQEGGNGTSTAASPPTRTCSGGLAQAAGWLTGGSRRFLLLSVIKVVGVPLGTP